MRIVYLGNNWLGWKILEWLKAGGEEIAALVMHPTDRRKFGAEIIAAAGVDPARVFDGTRLKEPAVMEAIRALKPDIGLSVLFGYILKEEFLSLFPRGVVNLHPALLPWNRGAYPNVWSIVDGTPAGATLHYIDKDVDTGDKIAQREVEVEPVDTGESLYRKLELASVELFKETWPHIKAGKVARTPQSRSTPGTLHRTKDVGAIDEIDRERSYKAGELINILRARTFPPYKGAFFKVGGRTVYIRVSLEYGREE